MKNYRRLYSVPVLLAVLFSSAASTQQSSSRFHPPNEIPVRAALLSDPHFDPFRDPGKVRRLAAAPVSEWSAILSAPASSDAAQTFAELQKSCSERLPDADSTLVNSAFEAAAADKPAFVLVAGDMLVHAFSCRYHALLDSSGTNKEGMADFAAKTIEFQLAALKQRFPNTPVHLALGNNDSDCEDYSLDEDSHFLDRLAPAVAADWTGISNQERRAALQDFKRFGSYALPLPAPIVNARLLVLDDLYMSSDYRGACGRKANSTSGTALLAWISAQLDGAKRAHQAVWVLAHIPPEVNVYRTYKSPRDICHGQKPASFFDTNAFNDLLTQYADTVRVFISGHTHMDEIHLLEGSQPASGTVALKTIPSVSPISGNAPAYLLAKISPRTAEMEDYELRTASSSTGPEIRWSTAYDFQRQYHEPAFTSNTVEDLLKRWQQKPEASAAEINSYASQIGPGLRGLAFRASFPQQLCAMRHSSDAGFIACACKAIGGVLPPVQTAK